MIIGSLEAGEIEASVFIGRKAIFIHIRATSTHLEKGG